MAGPLLSVPHLIIFATGAVTGAIAQRKLDERQIMDRVDDSVVEKAEKKIRQANERQRKREERRRNRHIKAKASKEHARQHAS